MCVHVHGTRHRPAVMDDLQKVFEDRGQEKGAEEEKEGEKEEGWMSMRWRMKEKQDNKGEEEEEEKEDIERGEGVELED